MVRFFWVTLSFFFNWFYVTLSNARLGKWKFPEFPFSILNNPFSRSKDGHAMVGAICGDSYNLFITGLEISCGKLIYNGFNKLILLIFSCKIPPIFWKQPPFNLVLKGRLSSGNGSCRCQCGLVVSWQDFSVAGHSCWSL